MNKLKLFNSLGNQLEDFKPLEEGKVSIYVCGPTVYNDAHIGNLRPPVFFDFLKRYLTFVGYQVTLCSNFTDIDDKIINAAKEQGISEIELSQKYIKRYQNLLEKYNVIPFDYTPKVTDNIDNIINFINRLLEKGFAYKNDNEVYFSFDNQIDYGRLSNIKLDELMIGSRVEVNLNKKNPLDFVLWKNTKEGLKWASPFGEGRPGWHTECVVMIEDIFKKMIDIHGGGFDLKFPHHENEIAQSMANSGHPIANYWLHVGFINIDDQKMSKSLGNFSTGLEVVEKYGVNLARFMLLSTHYRAPINFSKQSIENYQIELNKILYGLRLAQVNIKRNNLKIERKIVKEGYVKEFLEQLENDINIANGLTVIHSLLKQINFRIRKEEFSDLVELENQLYQILSLFGFKLEEAQISQEDLELFADYYQARQNKDFIKSDQIRTSLIEKQLL